MARTKADAAKKAGAKAPRKTQVLRSDSGNATAKAKGDKYGGGNTYCPRPTPKWQMPITNFFNKKRPSESASGASEDLCTPSSSHGEEMVSNGNPYEAISEEEVIRDDLSEGEIAEDEGSGEEEASEDEVSGNDEVPSSSSEVPSSSDDVKSSNNKTTSRPDEDDENTSEEPTTSEQNPTSSNSGKKRKRESSDEEEEDENEVESTSEETVTSGAGDEQNSKKSATE